MVVNFNNPPRTKQQTVFEISAKLTHLKEKRAQIENSPEPEKLLAQLLNEETTIEERDQKLNCLAEMVQDLERQKRKIKKQLDKLEAQYKLAIAPLREERDRLDTLAFCIQNHLINFLTAQEISSVETEDFKLTQYEHGAGKVEVLGDSPYVLPEQFRRVEVSIDKKALQEYLRENNVLLDSKGNVLAKLGDPPKKLKITIQ